MQSLIISQYITLELFSIGLSFGHLSLSKSAFTSIKLHLIRQTMNLLVISNRHHYGQSFFWPKIKNETLSFSLVSKLFNSFWCWFLFHGANGSLAVRFTVFSTVFIFSQQGVGRKNRSHHVSVERVHDRRIHSRLNGKCHEGFIH